MRINSRIWFQIYFCYTVPLKACANSLRIGSWLPVVMSDSPGFDTPGRLTPGRFLGKIWITQRNHNQKYFYPLLSGPGSLELWKNSGWKFSLIVPLIRIQKSQMTCRGMIPRGHCLAGVSYPRESYKNLNNSAKSEPKSKKF